MTVKIVHGDCVDVMRGLPDASVDSVVCDPPYHLTSIVKRFGGENAAPAKGGVYARSSAGFMGKQWDGGDIAFRVELWTEVCRVLKPGGYMVAFGSSRGHHRMFCAIEDAGLIIHPMLGWITGQGFPKAHKVEAEGWEGWRYGLQSLKPAIEPICLAQKPMSEKTGTLNVLKHGTGAINVDGCRVEGVPRTTHADGNRVTSEAASGHMKGKAAHGPTPAPTGRWPANVCHDGSEEVLEAFARFGEKVAIPVAKKVFPDYSPSERENNSWNKIASTADSHSSPNDTMSSVALAVSAVESTADLLYESQKAGQAPVDGSTRKTDAGIANGEKKTAAESTSSLSTDGLGKRKTDPSQMDLMSIIGTTTEPTIESKTCNSSQQRSTMPIINNSESGSAQSLTEASSDDAVGASNGCRSTISPAVESEAIRATASLAQSHTLESGSEAARGRRKGGFGNIGADNGDPTPNGPTYADAGNPARFFFCGKATREEREIGCYDLAKQERAAAWGDLGALEGNPRKPASGHVQRIRNTHPTVKPLALMQWLCRLVTPPGGTVLDMFAGSGSTGIAADREGFNAILIEREAEYIEIARRRISGDAPLFGAVA